MSVSLSVADLVALCGAICAGVVWIVSKLEGIRRDLRAFVTDSTCKERRSSCPCLAAMKKESR